MIGELIGAGVSLLGGLFGKKKQEKTVTENTVDYQKMASSAAAAGFNPLTAIRNGGSAGFTTSTTTSPTTSALPGALQSIGGVLGDALSKQFDPLAKKQRQLDTALVDYQLRQLKEGPKAVPGTLYSGGTFQGTKVTRNTASKTKGGFIGPAMPEHLKLGVGKELPLYVWGVDDRGKRHRIANPDLPDLDQLFVPSPAIVASEAQAAKDNAGSWWEAIKHRYSGKPVGQRKVIWGRAGAKPSAGGGW